ncbi:hypothetical protein CsSME_00028225 [Camellia sinensis var. sinensis]
MAIEAEAHDIRGVDRALHPLLPLDSNLQMARLFTARSHGRYNRRHHARPPERGFALIGDALKWVCTMPSVRSTKFSGKLDRILFLSADDNWLNVVAYLFKIWVSVFVLLWGWGWSGFKDSGFIPIFVYAIFGSSRQLAIGPVALVSLLVSNVLGNIVDSSDELYTELAILLALMVGVLECIMGLLSCSIETQRCKVAIHAPQTNPKALKLNDWANLSWPLGGIRTQDIGFYPQVFTARPTPWGLGGLFVSSATP